MAKRRAPTSPSAANHAQARAPDPGDVPTDPVSVAVRVRPGAGRTQVGGRYQGPHGPALIVTVAARAVDGQATEAARRALAEALGVRPAAVTLRVGAASRNKVFLLATHDAEIRRRLVELRDGTR